MAISRPVRLSIEVHEEAESIALIMSIKNKKIIEKNSIIKLAVDIGLKELRRKNKRSKQ